MTCDILATSRHSTSGGALAWAWGIRAPDAVASVVYVRIRTSGNYGPVSRTAGSTLVGSVPGSSSFRSRPLVRLAVDVGGGCDLEKLRSWEGGRPEWSAPLLIDLPPCQPISADRHPA